VTAAVLAGRRLRCLKNSLAALTPWQRGRNAAFALAGLGLLLGLHHGFMRLLTYLGTVPTIGALLLWKLTAMLMLTTFSMVVISSLLTSLTTLYYSFDLKFLMNAPLPLRTVFIDKSAEAIFFASWMIGLVIVPYVAALVRVNGYGPGFFAAFLALMLPFLVLAASFGLAFTLLLLALFPSSRTRDAVWVLSSLSLTLLYGAVRFAEPERLVRPDALHAVAEYLHYLQAPTAPYFPSWWLTRALRAYTAGRMGEFWAGAGLLYGAAALVYAFLVWLAGRVYFAGYSGAQEGALRRYSTAVRIFPETLVGRRLRLSPSFAALFWKERKTFLRDVKHWSQLLLIFGLVFVYLFSIRSLPLDNADLKSLVSFLNVGTAGFVMAALGLRFTYPSISLEGRSWWVLGVAPVDLGRVMRQKFLFSAAPMTVMALVLSLATNHLLEADRFTSWLSCLSLLLIAWSLASMGIGFGALFPMFNVENIHQIESSLGGFIYMASSLAYIGGVIMVLSWPMQMHFQQRFGKVGAWDWRVVAVCLAAFVALNAAAMIVPWRMGRKALEEYEA
jgi:ABC-2 type transport system permease protein